jgi:dipeptidyl aminopeptidase/acylaminoacyl peptidase
VKAWRELLAANKGASILLEVYLKREGEWLKLPRARNQVSADPIDGFLSYRLIEPGYVHYWDISIRQRSLDSFEERELFNNGTYPGSNQRLCVNCHAFQDYRGANMQLHGRGERGGTVVARDGRPVKVNLKVGDIVSAGVYPAWHPSEGLIAYSVNQTGQVFHSRDTRKVEVQDMLSDLILYDVDRNTVAYIARDSNELETFPAWSPNGHALYYASAPYTPTLPNRSRDAIVNYKEIRYNIVRRSFNPVSREFGEPEVVFDAVRAGKSATLPRVSPDGRHLLFTLGEFGTFHIWHPDSDLYILDLQTGEARPLANANSANVESYHAWSSSGKWIVFSSRRDDGSYTRPYITRFDGEGGCTKPFVLPQRDPALYDRLYKSFNIPEFTIEPASVSPRAIATAFSKEAVNARLVE